MIFLLDTNALTALSSEQPGFMERRLQFRPCDFGISSIVAFEISYGAHRGPYRTRDMSKFDKLALEVVPFDANDARAADKLRSELAIRGTPIGPYDILIAGQALARNLTLISRNVREFSRIEGLRVENWHG